MTETSNINDGNGAEAATEKQRQKAPKKKTVADLQAKLKKMRQDIAMLQEKQDKDAERNRRIREQAVGRTVIEMIENREIDPVNIAKVRDKVRQSCCKPNQVRAFEGTIFE